MPKTSDTENYVSVHDKPRKGTKIDFLLSVQGINIKRKPFHI